MVTKIPVTYVLAGILAVGLFVFGCGPAAQAPQQTAGQPGEKAAEKPAEMAAEKPRYEGVPFPTMGTPKYGGVLRTAQTDDPPNFDLYSNSTTNMQKFIWSAYNNVVLFDPYDGSKIIPDAAERWEVSKDGKEVTFYLHKNIKFHNGTPLTAKDVKFSLEFMKDPPKGNDIMLKEVMGSGAFKLKKYLRGTSVEMEKHPDYWQKGVPYLDGIMTYLIPDRGTRLAAFRTGNLDWYGLTALESPDIEKTMAGKISMEQGTGISWSTVNFNVNRRPFDNPKVREAMSLAIDRRGYIKAVQQDDAQLGGYVPPTSPFALPQAELEKLPGYGKDVEASRKRAKELLTEAGYPDGFETLQYVRRGSEDLAIYTQAEWKKIGINTTLKVLDSGPAYDALIKRDFDLFPWGHGLALDDPDAHYTELYLCGAPRNYSNICDQKVTDLFMKQSQELDPEKRKPLVWELEKYAVPLNIKIVLSWNNYRIGTWNHVKGYVRGTSTYNNYHFKQIWLDK